MDSGSSALAPRAYVIVTIVVWTLVVVVVLCLLALRSGDPPRTPVSGCNNVFKLGPYYAAFAFLSSLLMARFARIRRLWHAGILAVVAFCLLYFVEGPMNWLSDFVSFDLNLNFYPWNRPLPDSIFFGIQVALLLCVYGV